MVKRLVQPDEMTKECPEDGSPGTCGAPPTRQEPEAELPSPYRADPGVAAINVMTVTRKTTASQRRETAVGEGTSRLVATQQQARASASAGPFEGFGSSREQSQSSYRPQYFERPPRPPPPQLQGYRYDRYTQSGPGETSQASSLQKQRASRQIGPFPLGCAFCSRGHLGQCRSGSDAFYTCGRPGHMMQDCPNRDYGDMAQPANSTTGSAMSMHPSGHMSQSLAGRG
uniref:Uncharacterized protein LOC104229025 n=1 Tax=Nicotiana sylvestris TaxID=4096 RepID=A0A1U7WRG0_NICSY|nr:PREDICTED: uncharacterized protein LOC104229025 [Nicotiana sylvestris]